MKKKNYSGEIVDAHMHLWDRANNYDWLDQTIFRGRLAGNFLIEDYLKKITNQRVSKAVHIECHGFPHDPVQETKWVQEIASKHPILQAIVGYAPLHHPEIEILLKGHCQFPLMRGIRMNLRFGPQGFFLVDRGDYMLDKAWQYGFSLLSKYRLSFDMQIYPEQIPDAIKLLQTYNDVPVILDHLALPYNPSDKTFEFWKENIQAIASIPTAFIKLSGIGVFFQGLEQRETICKYIKHAIDAFGVHRCLFASNCPPDTAFIDFDSIYQIFKEVANEYTDEEQNYLFYQNACKFYRM